jgi:hypothetical protein
VDVAVGVMGMGEWQLGYTILCCHRMCFGQISRTHEGEVGGIKQHMDSSIGIYSLDVTSIQPSTSACLVNFSDGTGC